MKKILLIGIVIILALLIPWLLLQKEKQAEIIIGNKKIAVEIASTPSKRERGLMDREYLDKDKGMLFIFPDSDIHPFWMKNTRIPLDIIWIEDSKIVEITTLLPETPGNIPQYTPLQKTNYVLEVNAGFIKNNNLKLGDEVKIQL